MADKEQDAAAQEKAKNLKLAISQIEKSFGKGSIMLLGESAAAVADVPVISTGSMTLDMALGIGGVPAGRIIEVFGPESSGKTTLCLHIIANAQAQGGRCAIIDAEHAIDPQYAQKIGVDIKELLISQPDCGEDALNIVDTLVRSGAVSVVVVDSVAALVPKAEIEGQMGDSHVGLQARLMSQALRKITGIASRTGTCVIFTNQIREKIGVMYGNPETTPGGNALKFYASVRMDIRKIGVIKMGENVLGNRARVKVIKNKMAPPFKVAEFDIMYNEGISKIGSVLDVATDLNILEKRGSWFSFEGEQLGQGRDQTKALLTNSPELLERISARVWEKIAADRKGASAAAEDAGIAGAMESEDATDL